MSNDTPTIAVSPMVRMDAAFSAMPPTLLGHATPDVRRRVEKFYASVADLFELWVARRRSPHTQRAYRQDVTSFINFMHLQWPEESWRMYTVSVKDVQAFREKLIVRGAAPKTMNRRISSLSSFYKFLAATAAELRLPITVPNPAHAQFISRECNDPVHETKALSATRARQLMSMPAGDTLVEARDRAILKFYLYTGARLGAGCRLKVTDFHRDGEEATIRLSEKGGRHRTIVSFRQGCVRVFSPVAAGQGARLACGWWRWSVTR